MVKQAREARQWTQEELRKRLADLGITLEKTAMIRLESGKRPIRFNEVVALSRLLDMNLRTTGFAPADMTDDELATAEAQLEATAAAVQKVARELDEVQRQEYDLRQTLGALRTERQMLRYRINLAHAVRQVREHFDG